MNQMKGEDSKIASSKLVLKAEIGLAGLIKAQFEWIKKVATTNIAQGYRGHAAAQGYRGRVAAQGYRGHAAAQGYRGHAEVHGKNSIAVSFGIDGRVKGGKVGNLLTLYEWKYEGGEWKPIQGITKVVDGEEIKCDVWYRLEDGEFVECGDEED